MRRPSQETVLFTTSTRERITRVLSVLALTAGICYLAWRLLATLNPDALLLSSALWLAEAWTVMTAGLLFFSAWDPFSRGDPPPAPPGRSVDVFVPTLNEPLWVVRRALIGALAIEYPHRTWLLDDGNRPEMRTLAAELGAGYLPRESSEGAKAGHLNYALECTEGEFVVLFDADHIATPEFLDRTLGWFDDEQVAFVQTPQEFYNVDSFEHNYKSRKEVAWHGQTIFYRLIQPGKDRWNAAFFCGSNAVLRRSALEDAGGFPTETVTEDIHLSILLHARGWRSVFHREVLAYGLAPQTAVGYQSQRLRWGQGGMQVLREANPATIPGLTLAQRLNYLSSLLPWFEGWQKVIFYAIPPLFLLTGALPLRADALRFAAVFIGTYGLLLLAAKLAARGTAKFLRSDAYSAVTFPVFVKVTLGLFVRRRLKFAVTDKEGQHRVPIRTVRWQAAFLLFTAIGIGVGGYRLATGAENHVLAFWVSTGWAGFNFGMLSWAVHHILTTVERRGQHRVPAFLPVEWQDHQTSGLGVLENMSEGGGLLRVHDDVGYRAVHVRLWPATYQVMTGMVQWRKTGNGETLLGLRWSAGPHPGRPEDLTAMMVLFAQRRFLHHVDTSSGRTNGSDWRPDRLHKIVPVRILDAEEEPWGLLHEDGGGGVVLVHEPVRLGARLRLSPWDGMPVWRGTVTAVRQLRLTPFSVFEVHLANLSRDGRRVPGRDPLTPATSEPAASLPAPGRSAARQ